MNTPMQTGAAPQWVEVLSHTDPRYGGLSSAVPALARCLADGQGGTAFRMQIAAFCAPDEEIVPEAVAPGELAFWPASRVAWMRNRTLRQRFAESLRGAEGIHIHGLWETSTAVAAGMARRLRVPYVVSAHGMLEPWALRQSRWRKRVYAALVERRNLRGARALHALTGAEARQFAAFGARCPVAVVPNPVEVPEAVSAEGFWAQFPDLRGTRVVLFCGRLHPKKGLDLLLGAWALLAGRYPQARLVLAGPDSAGTRAQLEGFVAQHGLGGSVVFAGMLRGEQKWSALAAAEAAVLPSRSEGLSMSVLEAMGMGRPVLITEGCNLPEVRERGAGWVVEPAVSAIYTALSGLLAQSPAENAAMGQCGARLVQQRYTPRVVARQMVELYTWAAGGVLPVSVELLERGADTGRRFSLPATEEAF